MRQLCDETCKTLEGVCSEMLHWKFACYCSTLKKPKLEVVNDTSWVGFMQGKQGRF